MMKAERSRDPLESRLESGRCVMLYDPSLAGNFDERWFDPGHWSAMGAKRGEAAGRGATLFFATADREYALRHYRRGGLVAQLLGDRYLDLGEERSRPIREFRITRHLQRLGLPVAPVVAARHAPDGFFCRGDLITVRLMGTRTLAECLTSSPAAIDWPAVGATIARFHALGLCHADLNAHNLLVDTGGQWHLIDFDRASLRPPGLWCDANLVRLRRSLLKLHDREGGVLDEQTWHALLGGYRNAHPTQRSGGGIEKP
jgi:3-deoxy-D-manno-octulosonic acid kinase